MELEHQPVLLLLQLHVKLDMFYLEESVFLVLPELLLAQLHKLLVVTLDISYLTEFVLLVMELHLPHLLPLKLVQLLVQLLLSDVSLDIIYLQEHVFLVVLMLNNVYLLQFIPFVVQDFTFLSHI